MNVLTNLRRNRWILLSRRKLRKKIRQLDSAKLNIGSGATSYVDWVNLDLPFFDLTKKAHWDYVLGKSKPRNILMEHVLEHLTEDEVKRGIRLCSEYLVTHGVIRIAVPDRFHPNPDYIEYVRPNGTGAGADDHKSFWSYKDFLLIAETIGLKIRLLEYYDENGNLHTAEISGADGVIKRCHKNMRHKSIPDYSSLIVDFVKQ